MQGARRNYMTEAFLGKGECFEARSAHRRGPRLSCVVDSSSSCLLFKASSQLPHVPSTLHATSQGPSRATLRSPSSPWDAPCISHPLSAPGRSPALAQSWSPGTTRSLWPTETSRTGRPRRESAFKRLKIRQGLWEIMTSPGLTACKTNCKAHLPDPSFPL